jgi:uncharacterized protein (DUF433 family)
MKVSILIPSRANIFIGLIKSKGSYHYVSPHNQLGTLLTRTPGLHGGCPHLKGKGVTVRRIVSWYKRGLTAEEIGDRIGHLTFAEVYAALAYYHANTAEIETDLAQQAAEANFI